MHAELGLGEKLMKGTLLSCQDKQDGPGGQAQGDAQPEGVRPPHEAQPLTPAAQWTSKQEKLRILILLILHR
jgi:hypothetical protein